MVVSAIFFIAGPGLSIYFSLSSGSSQALDALLLIGESKIDLEEQNQQLQRHEQRQNLRQRQGTQSG
jgi:hypothetical protein